MPEIVAECPRCGASHVTVDLKGSIFVRQVHFQSQFEIMGICRHCRKSVIYFIGNNPGYNEDPMNYSSNINEFFVIFGFVGVKDNFSLKPPDHLQGPIENAFVEGAKCKAIGCWNAAATMVRLCIDLATKPLLPPDGTEGINFRQRRDLGLRLQWLFDNHKLPEGFRELAACIHQDGNDGAHAGTLTKNDADDVLDFTIALLERLFTEPERLRIAKERRDARRAPPEAS